VKLKSGPFRADHSNSKASVPAGRAGLQRMMADKHILVADADLPALEEYGRVLGEEWKVTLVPGALAALNHLASHPCDIVVADYDLPDGDGGQLLDRIKTKYPKTIRILMVAEAERDRLMAEVQGSHLILTKPCDSATLKSAVQRALAINVWLVNDNLRELVGRLRTFPIVPSLYLEVVSALKAPHTTTAEVGAIIAKDMAMMTKMLQVINSACFGLPRKINDPVEAVGILGFETIKSMVVTLKLLSQYDKVKPVYFSIDRLWRHSTEVARLARGVAITQTHDRILGESAFTAGLTHDLGKLILATNFDEQYSGAQALARKRQIPLEEVEKDIFGAGHGELGAYLLGLWGMPPDTVECAALHHNPSRSDAKQFTPLTAVHVANALVYEVRPDKEGLVTPKVDEAYLAQLGVAGQLDSWRQIALDPDLNDTQFTSRTGETGVLKKSASPAPRPAPRPVLQPERRVPAAPVPRFRWLYASLGATAFVMCFWFGGQALVHRMLEPVYAPPGQITQSAPVEAAPPAAALVAAQPAEKPVETPAPSAPLVASNAPAPAPPPAAPPPPTAKELAFAELQLESIFFSKSNPTAVISGTWVRPRDRLPAGATVVEIGPSSVTVEFENERKILALK
jgi:HD-like signal output (HDOD) protein/CheY-like chemotaxis protein